MKDAQGLERGKCNSCECEEYRCPKEGFRCDYCNHTPGEHVRIVELGECHGCQPAGNCPKYQSSKRTEYTDCEYCGCPASSHSGAEALRRPKQNPGSPSTSSGGTCKYPGCKYPKRTEESTGKTHDFCSRTCAQKYQHFFAQGMTFGGSGGHGDNNDDDDGPVHSSYYHSEPVYYNVTTDSDGGGSHQTRLSSATNSAAASGASQHNSSALCKHCQKNPPNPGHSLCQTCFGGKGFAPPSAGNSS